MFIAKISAGRTVREFIGGTMAAPVVYTCIWLVIFGGAGFHFFGSFCIAFFYNLFVVHHLEIPNWPGVRMEREAAGAGLCCHNINLDRCFFSISSTLLVWSVMCALCRVKNTSYYDPSSLILVDNDMCLDGSCNGCSTRFTFLKH